MRALPVAQPSGATGGRGNRMELASDSKEYCLLHEIMHGANACDEKNCAHQAFCAVIRNLEQRVARMEEHTRECKR